MEKELKDERAKKSQAEVDLLNLKQEKVKLTQKLTDVEDDIKIQSKLVEDCSDKLDKLVEEINGFPMDVDQ